MAEAAEITGKPPAAPFEVRAPKRTRYRFVNGTLVEYEPHEGPPPPRRGPTIISDHHAPFRSMADGRTYESKSAYRRSLKENGFVELGNEMPKGPPAPPDDYEADAAEAYERVEAGQKPERLPSELPAEWKHE